MLQGVFSRGDKALICGEEEEEVVVCLRVSA